MNVARLLLERGAEVDPVETRWHATPMGVASFHRHTAILDLLDTRSRDLYDLCFEGYADSRPHRAPRGAAAGDVAAVAAVLAAGR